jgi:hypothetical protein
LQSLPDVEFAVISLKPVKLPESSVNGFPQRGTHLAYLTHDQIFGYRGNLIQPYCRRALESGLSKLGVIFSDYDFGLRWLRW